MLKNELGSSEALTQSGRGLRCWQPQHGKEAQSQGKPPGDENLLTCVTERKKRTIKGKMKF